VPDFFGRVKQGAYSRAARALVKKGLVLRENEKVSAKFEDTERLTLPPSGPYVPAAVAMWPPR